MNSEPGQTLRPRPRLALWLSILLPGLGLVYAGAPLRGFALFVAALLGLAGIGYGVDHGAQRPEYVAYGVIGALLLASAWWGGARHAGNFAARQSAWPPLYRFFARPSVRRALWAARVEAAMALLFGALVAFDATLSRIPYWVPEPPRYWFLYEVLGALYLAVFHSVAKFRVAGFFVTAALAAVLATLALGVPQEVVAFAFLFALPSSWFSLRHRGDASARIHWMRVFVCILIAYVALFAFAILVEVWEIVSGEPQYRMRLIREEELSIGVFGLIYYLLRAAFEMLIHHFEPASRA
jgi:hypothetical protein